MASAASRSTDRPRDAGFTLIEVMISMMLIALVALGVGELFGVSVRATHDAKMLTSTTAMASQKMEELRGLTWGYDTSGQMLPVTDTSTDLSTEPPSSGGEGLNPSPTDSLDTNESGYCDFLDANGTWVGNGTTAPAGAIYIRRWNIQPLPTNPNTTLVLQVLVTSVVRDAQYTGSGTRPRLPGDSLLVSVKTRKSS
jgi:prepilin-type N-terminal cleavage/methylation domain-containing protein